MTGGHDSRYRFEAGSMTITQCYVEARAPDQDLQPANATVVGALEFSFIRREDAYDVATMLWPVARRSLAYRFSRS